MDPTPHPLPTKPLILVVIGLCVLFGAGYFYVIPRVVDTCMRKSNSFPDLPSGTVGLGIGQTDRTECYYHKALAQNNARLCLKISNDDQETHIVSCVTQIAEQKNDPNTCDLLKSYDDGQEDERCKDELHSYNLVGKYQYNQNLNADFRRQQLQIGWTQTMQEHADRQFQGTPFSWKIQFNLIDEYANYTDCQSKGTMVATMRDRAPWDALSEADKKSLVLKLMTYVYGSFGSRQAVDVKFGDTLLAHGDDSGCGRTPFQVTLQ